MRKTTPAIGLALLGCAIFRQAPGADVDLDARFAAEVRPFLEANCLACHDAKAKKGDLDLSAYTSAASVAEGLDQWEAVADQVKTRAMPPAKAKRQPDDRGREALVEWVGAIRWREAARNAGDPGPIPPRRLSNAEYDASVRDLTGVDLRPTREFPVDPANASGFDNSAESLTMSPALVRKYLEAARSVADHLVLKPDGLDFADHPVVADTDRDKFSVRRIIDFYKRQPTDLADDFLAAWTLRHREALGRPRATLEEVAASAKVSPKYLATLWAALTDQGEEVGPIAALRALWLDLPAPPSDPKPAAEKFRDAIVGWRKALVPKVKNLNVRGMNGGSQPLVLWKDRQFVANRRRYAGGGSDLGPGGLDPESPAAKALAPPVDPDARARYEASFARFCSIIPDAFVVSERARVYIEKEDKGNVGRLLSAGFHSMTGYFRDDAPLAELILDDAGRAELDRLWREFQAITGAPLRQYASFLWFDRTDSTFMRSPEFDFARAEDKAAASSEMIRRLGEVYRAKAARSKASDEALGAIDVFFVEIDDQIRRVEADRLAAEPIHVRGLQDLAQRAFRRPLSAEERDGIAAFYADLRKVDGLGHEDAVRDSLVGILMSPHFCYRVDPAESTGEGPTRPLTGHGLASRLSYFLWSSLPDDELLALAGSGELKRPEVLATQARRMLLDPRARALGTEFLGNWLDFRRFEGHNSVDRGRFPSFDDTLRRSMFEEPVRFFLDVVRQDRSILTLLDADHSFVNPSLARHYGMPPLEGGPDAWSRVEGARSYGRGGLPSMAVFLTQNSPGLRTSPVKRGYWVARRLLGEDIPAPPANVPDLPVDEAKAERTLRQSLEIHRADAACAGCHVRFDPIGLAFEGYGPIGELRERDLGGHPVDTRADFPGGFAGEGLAGLRAYLKSRRQADFVDTFCRKLLAYGLGRGLKASDDATLEAMHARLSADDHRFGGLVEAIVTSPQFRYKRVDGSPSGG